MSVSRLDQLKAFYEEDPSDPFNIYALALELSKSDISLAKKLFEELLSKHADYLPTYYHAAKLFETLNERETAIAVYQKGIAVAQKTGNTKAARELRAALDELEFD